VNREALSTTGRALNVNEESEHTISTNGGESRRLPVPVVRIRRRLKRAQSASAAPTYKRPSRRQITMTTISELDRLKRAAADAAVAMVEDGMIVGLGTGSTTWIALGILGQRVAEGLRVIGIPTSRQTEREARRLGIPLSTLAEHDHIDVTIDGADEVEVATLSLLKGRGGALLGEKIVASASEHLIIIVDETKLVERLGLQSAVAVEVVPFGWSATARKLRNLVTALERRTTGDGEPFITDGGHYILDCACGEIEDAEGLRRQLDETVGVVEHGLFLGIASRVIVGGSHGVRVLQRTRGDPTARHV
jgi:ribose 5-phosphate isomerase A